MRPFTPEQQSFLETISAQENESDWINIPGHVALVEKKIAGKIVGMAGVTMRYHILPSLFIAVSHTQRGRGTGLELMKQLMGQWKGILFLTYYRKKEFLGTFYGKYGFKKIIHWKGGRTLCVKL
jgi:N-acetylglutamate synthase-like GNAT family acetyltransferase